jgi:predicted RNase H-like nuclease
VFTPPCRAALAGIDRSETRALNVHATGRSLSEQALGIVPKIREVDALITPSLQEQVKEVHPEVVFAALAGGGVEERKGTEDGRRVRLGLLPAAFARAAPTRAARPYPASQVRLDDYVDALAALYVAVRLARGRALRLPRGAADRDELGLSMEIYY